MAVVTGGAVIRKVGKAFRVVKGVKTYREKNKEQNKKETKKIVLSLLQDTSFICVVAQETLCGLIILKKS